MDEIKIYENNEKNSQTIPSGTHKTRCILYVYNAYLPPVSHEIR